MTPRPPAGSVGVCKVATVRWVLGGLAWAFVFLFAPRAQALDVGPGDDPLSLEVHGFVSQGFILTAGNPYLVPKSTRGSFEFAEVGINFSKRLTDSLRVGVQLFAQDLGARGNYDAKLDWFHLDYRFADWLGLRAGRLKIPYALYNEIQDVDVARAPILLPGSVYPMQSREILFAQTGAELYGFARMGAAGALDYRLFGGTSFMDSESLTPPGVPFKLDFHVPYIVGGRLIWETPVPGLRIGGSALFLRLETTVLIPGMPSVLIESQSSTATAFAEFSLRELTLTAEYVRGWADQHSDNAALSPPIDETDEGAYVQAVYRVWPWFQPAAYYALFFPNVERRTGRANQQHDLALTLRFDIHANWLVKLEAHYMVGTAGLVDPLRVNPPDITRAQRRWAAFFAKTTAHF